MPKSSKPVKKGTERKKHINKQTERTEGLPLHVRQKETWGIYVVDMFKKGLSDDEIKHHLMLEKGMSIHSAIGYMSTGRAILRNDFIKDRETTIGLHLRRYDKDIQNLISIQPRTSNFAKATEIKTLAYLQLIELMGQKEKLLGFHSKSFNIKINNEVNVKVIQKPSRYDLSQLSFDEKIELMNLLHKAKILDSDAVGIIPNPKKNLETIQDIEYIDVTDESINISKIEKIGEEKKFEQPVSILPMIDAKAKLAQALRERAKKVFIDAGSKTAENDDTKNK